MAKKTRRGFMKSAGTAMASAGFFASWGTGCAYLKSNKTRKMPSPSSMSPIPQRILGRTKLPVTLLGFGVGPIIDSAVYRRAYELGIRYYHISFDKHSTKLPPWEKFNKEALTALRPFREQSVISYMTTVRSNKQELLEDLDEFLRLSGFGHIDVWFVCCPSPGLINEFGEALILARRAGKARWGALSTHSLHKTIPLLLVPDSPIDVVMLGYNHTSSADDNEYLIKLHDASLGITPMKPLAGRFFQKTSKDPSPLLRWLAMEERIHTIPVGMKTVAQVEQNVAALQKPFFR